MINENHYSLVFIDVLCHKTPSAYLSLEATPLLRAAYWQDFSLMNDHQLAMVRQPDLPTPWKTSQSHTCWWTNSNKCVLSATTHQALYVITSPCVYRQVRSGLEVVQDILKKASSGIKNIKDAGDELTWREGNSHLQTELGQEGGQAKLLWVRTSLTL